MNYCMLFYFFAENMSRSWLTMKLYHFSLVAYLLGIVPKHYLMPYQINVFSIVLILIRS